MKLFSTDIVNQVINHWVIDSCELGFDLFVFTVYPWVMHFIAFSFFNQCDRDKNLTMAYTFSQIVKH